MLDRETRKELSDLHEVRRALQERVHAIDAVLVDLLIEKAAGACEAASKMLDNLPAGTGVNVGEVIDRKYGMSFAAGYLRGNVRKELHDFVKTIGAEVPKRRR